MTTSVGQRTTAMRIVRGRPRCVTAISGDEKREALPKSMSCTLDSAMVAERHDLHQVQATVRLCCQGAPDLANKLYVVS
jgi:hypothetical protein